MGNANNIDLATFRNVKCPYCSKICKIEIPLDYAPKYVSCNVCKKTYIIEKRTESLQTFILEEAVYKDCDPDCHAIDMSACDEQ